MEFLYNIYCQIPSNELKEHLNEYILYILKNGDKVTIGNEDLTRILTRLIIEIKNVDYEIKLFLFAKNKMINGCTFFYN